MFFGWQLEEKARLEAEARAREHLLLQQQRRDEEEEDEEEQLQEELQRLQELQKLRAVKKKKKERPVKDCPKLDLLAREFQTAPEPVSELDHIPNGSLERPKEKTSCHPPCRLTDHTEPRRGPGAEGDAVNNRDSKLLLRKGVNGKQPEPLSFLLDIMQHHKEGTNKQKLKHLSKASGEQGRKPPEASRAAEGSPRPRPSTEPKAKADLLVPAVQKREERKISSHRKQLNHVKEEKVALVPVEPAAPGEPPQDRLAPADSPQPKSKTKKSRKKKGDRLSSSIGKCFHGPLPA